MKSIKLQSGRVIDDSFDLNRMIPSSSCETLLFANYKKNDIILKYSWLEFEGLGVFTRELFTININ